MENNKVFKFLWRANAVFLFVAGIGLIALLIMFAALLISDFGGSYTPPPAISGSVDQSGEKEVFRLRAPSYKYNETKSDDFVYFQLRSGTDSWSKLGSGESSQLRNIGVFDLNENTTHWVFPDAQQEIENYDAVNKNVMIEGKDKKLILTGYVLTVAKSLEDGSVGRDLWVMSPSGKALKKVLSDISDAPKIEPFGDDKIKLIIETKTHIDVYPFDVDMLTVGEPTRVSIP